MKIDRAIVERIKGNLAQYSPEELQQIIDSQDQNRWSAEAVTAACEVFQVRNTGLSFDPTRTNDTEENPSVNVQSTDSMAWVTAMNALALPLGFLVLPLNREVEDDPIDRDIPVPFGPESAWIALDTTDTAAVANLLGLKDIRSATWAEGIAAAGQSCVFVTPPLGEWTLVVSARLFPPPQFAEFVSILLEGLGRNFSDAQYFCTSTRMDLHVWARSLDGRLIRGYGLTGAGTAGEWNEGARTDEERELGLFGDDEGKEASEFQELNSEERVLMLASCWSIDPSTLDEQYKEPVMGLLGKASWG
jgi:hypothetical protein